MKSVLLVFLSIFSVLNVFAETVVDVTGEGAEKITFSVNVEGDSSFTTSLKRNLDLTGWFKLSSSGAIKITGKIGNEIKAEGRGRVLTMPSKAVDAPAARMEARRLADKIVESFAHQKGFACDRIAFVSKKGGGVSELCTCYPDGFDILQLTSAGFSTVGPRWNGKDSILFTGLRKSGPQVFDYSCLTRETKVRWSFKGLTTGAVMSPDGKYVAIILSIHGNPELYILDTSAGSWQRLTTTPFASEGQPSWSPDGKSIVYVSDETRKPQLYVIDVATRKKTLLTKKGAQNVDPDWGNDNRIAYITKGRDGNQIAIIDMNSSTHEPQLVGTCGSWEHPSWSRDNRHVIASSNDALFVVDTIQDGADEPKPLFRNRGKWITPSWQR